jgi:hypothetical protein
MFSVSEGTRVSVHGSVQRLSEPTMRAAGIAAGDTAAARLNDLYVRVDRAADVRAPEGAAPAPAPQ